MTVGTSVLEALNLPEPPAGGIDVLVVAPHPDDAEISVGGTLLLCRDQGLKTAILELTNGEPTPHGSPEIRQRETEAASQILNVDWRGGLGFPNRQLMHTLETRQRLASVFRLLRPRIILAPWNEDAHPDHVVASELVDAARFWSKLSRTDEPGQYPLDGAPFWPPQLFYFLSIHLRISPRPSFVIDITSTIDRKMQAVGCYQSQLITGRPVDHPTLLDDIRDRARYWGWSIHSGYGEPFLCREEVRLCGLQGFL